MKRQDGFRNYKELTEEEKTEIVEEYFSSTETISQLGKKLKLTNRTLPQILKEKGVNTARLNRYTLNESYFENINSERKAYWLGYLYADGFIGDEHYNNIVFSQKKSDGYIIKQFADDIEFTGKLREQKSNAGSFKNGESQIVINFSSKKMANDLRKLNMLTCKSMTMSELPPIENKYMRHFIRGYFDGDGSIYETKRNYYKQHEYCEYPISIIGTIPFLEKIQKLMPVKTTFHDSHTPQMKYLCICSNRSIPIVYKYFYENATLYLKRKYDIFKKAIRYVNRKRLNENGINSKEVSA